MNYSNPLKPQNRLIGGINNYDQYAFNKVINEEARRFIRLPEVISGTGRIQGRQKEPFLFFYGNGTSWKRRTVHPFWRNQND